MFGSRTSLPFDMRHQRRLQQLVLSLARHGSYVLLSNSTAGEIVGLYDRNDQARRAGLRAHLVASRRSVNSNASRRGVVDEYLITNVGRYTASRFDERSFCGAPMRRASRKFNETTRPRAK